MKLKIRSFNDEGNLKFKKFVIEKSLVICNDQATDKKINKIKIKYFEI